MTSTNLSEKWGSKEIWLRALFVRSGLIWLFRDEFTELALGKLQSLESILTDAYNIANTEAVRCATKEEAFHSACIAINRQIDNRIGTLEDNSDLQRLKKVVCEAHACDPLKQIFDRLARSTRRIYHTNLCRKTLLDRQWLIDHPRGETRPGDYSDPYHVNGETRVKGNIASIELQIYLDHFDVASLLAVPAILTHELVCHAHAKEDRNDDRSLWAEGVMDWVASYFFDMWASAIELPYGLTKNHGNQLWEKRMTRSRFTGRLAADALVEWLTEDESVRSVSVARVLTAKFALQVNVVDAPLSAKDELASRLVNIRRDGALREAIGAWRHDDAPAASLLA